MLVIEMLRAEDFQLGEQTFEDPMTQASFYSCVLRGNGAPTTCQFISETESSASFMTECMAYNDASPYFLKCHGFGRENYPEGSFVLVVTEPVEYNLAVDLQRRIAEGRRYSEEEIKAIAKTCIESLAVVWRSSIADQGHGNLTPSSVFMTKEGIYKLGSFNSALAFKKYQTPYACYLHPRAERGQVTKVEADIYATGILIYQLCALDCQGGPAFNTSDVHLKRGWTDLHYPDYHLGETWYELMKVNRTGATDERIRKLVNLSPNFSARVVSSPRAPFPPQEDSQPPPLASQLVPWELDLRTPHWSRPPP